MPAVTPPDQPREPEVPPVQAEVVEDGGTQREQIAKRDDDPPEYELSYREGPLPPDELEHYNRLVPGFAKDYLEDIRNESQHRREMERAELQLERDRFEQGKEVLRFQERVINSNQQRSTKGLNRGTVIFMSGIIAAVILGLSGRETTAVAVVGSLAAVALVSYGTDAFNKSRQKEITSNSDTLEFPEEKDPPRLPGDT
ncbi:MAG: DUF2335 domain-containing protein [Synechococcaceae cyanobacterium SM2_3_2]|nr:DUF2335 domain-containing protein [Synechococcaceae cyanobacterium SM2_3_2]